MLVHSANVSETINSFPVCFDHPVIAENHSHIKSQYCDRITRMGLLKFKGMAQLLQGEATVA